MLLSKTFLLFINTVKGRSDQSLFIFVQERDIFLGVVIFNIQIIYVLRGLKTKDVLIIMCVLFQFIMEYRFDRFMSIYNYYISVYVAKQKIF